MAQHRPPPTISPEVQLQMTQEISAREYKNILIDFDKFLREIWEDGKRDWAIYSTETSRYSWDFRPVETRSK